MCDVLLLEDDALLRGSFAEILEADGYSVREAGSPDEAWAVLHDPAEGVRVLMADKDLGGPPGEPDGFAIAMAALRLRPGLTVVYASGQPGVPAHGLTPRERILPKPFAAEALRALAREVIR